MYHPEEDAKVSAEMKWTNAHSLVSWLNDRITRSIKKKEKKSKETDIPKSTSSASMIYPEKEIKIKDWKDL